MDGRHCFAIPCLRQLRLGYGLDDRGVGDTFPAMTNFSLLHNVPTGSGAQPASYPVRTRGCFPRGKAVEGRETDSSPQFRTYIKNCGAFPPLPHTSSWRGG
jgi:hypothetical protein